MTFLEAHAHARQVLADAQSLPRDEAHARARLLLDFAAGQRYAHLMAPSQVLEDAHSQQFHAALARAARGEPLPYIVGQQEFAGRTFEVGAGTLIPRPETEVLVEAALKYLPMLSGEGVEVADLGTGSGAIAVTLALESLRARVLATDISPEALEIAARNAQSHGVERRVEFVLSDNSWTTPLEGRRLDAVVSNPPYIATDEIESLQVEVRLFEPRAALDGGADGLGVYRLFARELGKYLQRDGFVALEVGAGQWDGVAQMFESRGWRVEEPVCDFQKIKRVLVAFVGEEQPTEADKGSAVCRLSSGG